MKKTFLFLAFLVLFTSSLWAAVDTAKKSNTQLAAAAQKKDTDRTPKVVLVTVFRHPGSSDSAAAKYLKGTLSSLVAFPGNTLCFRVTHPLDFLKSRPTDQSHVQLYVNGLPMTGLVSDWYSKVSTAQVQKGTNLNLADTATINIELVRSSVSQQSWNFLYRNAAYCTDSYIDIAHTSIGWENMSPLETTRDNDIVTIAFFHQHAMLLWGGLYMVILVLFLWLAIGSDILRSCKGGPYSLSNTQLLFWTALVMGAYIYLLLLTDSSTIIPSSILGLMGISLGTTSAATLINQNKQVSQNVVAKGHDNFIRDLLSDGNSYSVARVQTFAWNLVLGGYFISFTVANKAMPDFSSTLLLLAGASSVAYLANKVPENTPATVNAQQQVQAAANQQPNDNQNNNP